MLLARLAEAGRQNRTPTDHFVRLLRGWGWECVEGATFQDAAGRRFSLVSSSLIHIMSLLMWHWGSVIRDAVQHRKGLEQVGVVHMVQVGLLPSERGLLGQLVSDRHFTKDARSHFAGSNCDELCPHARDIVVNTVSLIVSLSLSFVPTMLKSFVGLRVQRCCMDCGHFLMVSLSGRPGRCA